MNVRPPEVIIWNRGQLQGLVNVFEDKKEYLSITSRMREKTSNGNGKLLPFFLAAHHVTQSRETFFRLTI